MHRLSLISLSLLALVAAAGERGHRDYRTEKIEKARFLETRAQTHRWKSTMSLPTNYQEAHILPDAKLVWQGLYLDGGTEGFIFKDSEGFYFAFCTGPGSQTKDLPRRINAPVGSRLFAGDIHYKREGAVIAPSGTKAEEFLRLLLKRANQ